MGIITELLENDTDGSMRKHIVRAASAIGYVIVLGVVLFLGGLVWRMYNGAEVEIFGIRVATPDGETRISRVPPPDAAPASQSPAPQATTAAAPAPVAAATSAAQLHTMWVPMVGDADRCVQVSQEAMAAAQIGAIQRNPIGLTGTLRRAGSAGVDINVRCMFINGFSVAFAYAISSSGTTSMELIDALSREYTNRLGAVGIDRIGGTADRQAEEWNWAALKLETIDQCRDAADKVHERLQPTRKVISGPGVFSNVGQNRVTSICLKDGNFTTVVNATSSFSREDSIRLRDTLAREFDSQRR